MSERPAFIPDWCSPPGETVADMLDEKGMSLAAFASSIERSLSFVPELIAGRAEISSDLASRLAKVLGSSKRFWINREAQYREALARLDQSVQSPDAAEWLKELPVKDMVKAGWITPGPTPRDRVRSCLRFFGVPTVAAYREAYGDLLQQVAFRKSAAFESQPGAVAAWLRHGERIGAAIDCKAWNKDAFTQILVPIRKLTRERNPHIFISELKRLCAQCGVAIVVLKAPAGCRASGAVRTLPLNRRLMLLSFRHLSDDHFWFTFFHEAGHLVLHGDRPLILEGDSSESEDSEVEANTFAANQLIPQEYRSAMMRLPADPRAIMRFARDIDISRGIVVGQLEHAGRLRHGQLSFLKQRFAWE